MRAIAVIGIALACKSVHAERYALMPRLTFSHDLSGCQFFYGTPAPWKNGILGMRVFQTCNSRLAAKELLGDFSYTSKIDWFLLRCSENAVAWNGSLRFERQFWEGSATEDKNAGAYDFHVPNPLLYQDIFRRACDAGVRGAPAP